MKTEDQSIFLTVEDLATRWHKSPVTIRSDASRSPHALPPLCRLPGLKRLLWRLVDVEAFEAGHVVLATPPESSTFGRRRGRPTKTEQLRRRLNGGA